MTIKKTCSPPMQPLIWQRGKLLIIQEARAVTRGLHKAVFSPVAGVSEASARSTTQRCSLSQEVGVWEGSSGCRFDCSSPLDPVGQPKGFFVSLSNMYHSRRYCFMKYFLFLITTQGFPGWWHWLTDIHVVSYCFYCVSHLLICPTGH